MLCTSLQLRRDLGDDDQLLFLISGGVSRSPSVCRSWVRRGQSDCPSSVSCTGWTSPGSKSDQCVRLPFAWTWCTAQVIVAPSFIQLSTRREQRSYLARGPWRQVSMSDCPCQSHWNSSLRDCTVRNVLWSWVRHFLRKVESRGQDLAPRMDEEFFGGRETGSRPHILGDFFGGRGIAPRAPVLTLSGASSEEGRLHLRHPSSHCRGLHQRRGCTSGSPPHILEGFFGGQGTGSCSRKTGKYAQ